MNGMYAMTKLAAGTASENFFENAIDVVGPSALALTAPRRVDDSNKLFTNPWTTDNAKSMWNVISGKGKVISGKGKAPDFKKLFDTAGNGKLPGDTGKLGTGMYNSFIVNGKESPFYNLIPEDQRSTLNTHRDYMNGNMSSVDYYAQLATRGAGEDNIFQKLIARPMSYLVPGAGELKDRTGGMSRAPAGSMPFMPGYLGSIPAVRTGIAQAGGLREGDPMVDRRIGALWNIASGNPETTDEDWNSAIGVPGLPQLNELKVFGAGTKAIYNVMLNNPGSPYWELMDRYSPDVANKLRFVTAYRRGESTQGEVFNALAGGSLPADVVNKFSSTYDVTRNQVPANSEAVTRGVSTVGDLMLVAANARKSMEGLGTGLKTVYSIFGNRAKNQVK